MAARRPSTVLSGLLALAACWLLASRLSWLSGSPEAPAAFLTGRSGSAARGGVRELRTPARGFKEDFEAWRSTLTDEEKKLTLKQAQNEFNKKFRKSAEFSKDLPQEKLQAFSKILGKFFDAEAEDYKKEQDVRAVDYDCLRKKANSKKFDFSLKKNIVTIDRQADRLYKCALYRIKDAAARGEKYPACSPVIGDFPLQNNDTASHEFNLKAMEHLKGALQRGKAAGTWPAADQARAEALLAKGVPPVGQEFRAEVPAALMEEIGQHLVHFEGLKTRYAAEHSEAEVRKYVEETHPQMVLDMIDQQCAGYFRSRDEILQDAQDLKDFFNTQEVVPGRTKADVLRDVQEAFPDLYGAGELDEEYLAELAQTPAADPTSEEYRHPWGLVDTLYKSEAIDAFGQRYLLGLFEHKADAEKAFDDWNAEYEKARAAMAVELEQFSKQEQARVDLDKSGTDRIRKVIEEARR